MLALFFTFLSFLSTLSGGLIALRFKDKLHLVLAFASGAVVATALFEILPEIISQSITTKLPITQLLVVSAIGFLLFHIIERVIVFRHAHRHVGTLSASGFSLHSFFDGLGIGLGFLTSFQLGLVVSFAVLAHDFSDGLNTATVIIRNKGSRQQAILWLLLDALAPLVGVFASSIIHNSKFIILPYVLSFYFGFFLYLGAADLLPEAYHRHSSHLTILATILGFAFVYTIASFLF